MSFLSFVAVNQPDSDRYKDAKAQAHKQPCARLAHEAAYYRPDDKEQGDEEAARITGALFANMGASVSAGRGFMVLVVHSPMRWQLFGLDESAFAWPLTNGSRWRPQTMLIFDSPHLLSLFLRPILYCHISHHHRRTKFKQALGDTGETEKHWGTAMTMPFLSDRDSFNDATALIDQFGEHAGFEAAARADRYRNLGNHIYFCRWRQIERLIVLMSINAAVGTVH